MAVVKASKDVLPEDVYKILLKEQGKEKLRRGNGQFGLQATNWLIVRKWAKGILPDEFKEPTNGE